MVLRTCADGPHVTHRCAICGPLSQKAGASSLSKHESRDTDQLISPLSGTDHTEHTVGDEVHLYVVPATNLSLATVGRAKRPQQLGHGTRSGYERARKHQVTRPQTRSHVTMMPNSGHHATLRVDTGPAEDLSSMHWTTHAEHQEQATKYRVFQRQQQRGASVRVQQYGCGDEGS